MTTEWYMNMAAAMKKRDHAMAMRGRWDEQIIEAEAQIQQLAAQAPPQTTEPVQEPVEQEQVQ